MHRGALYLQAASGLLPAEVADSCFCDYDHFSFLAHWKDCLKADVVEAQLKAVKEAACFHITQDIPLIFFFFFGDLSLQHRAVRSLRQVHNRTLFRWCSTSAEYLKIAQQASTVGTMLPVKKANTGYILLETLLAFKKRGCIAHLFILDPLTKSRTVEMHKCTSISQTIDMTLRFVITVLIPPIVLALMPNRKWQKPSSKVAVKTTSSSTLVFYCLCLQQTQSAGMPFTDASRGLMCKHVGLILNTATRVSSFECRGAAFNCLHSEIAYLPPSD